MNITNCLSVQCLYRKLIFYEKKNQRRTKLKRNFYFLKEFFKPYVKIIISSKITYTHFKFKMLIIVELKFFNTVSVK